MNGVFGLENYKLIWKLQCLFQKITFHKIRFYDMIPCEPDSNLYNIE